MKGRKVQTRASLCQKTWRRLPIRAAAGALMIASSPATAVNNNYSGKSQVGENTRQVPATSFNGRHATQTTKPITLLLPSRCPPRLNLRSIHLHNGRVRQLSLCPAARRVAVAALDGTRWLTSSRSLNSPGLHRRNNVPHWQRVHQTHDGLRQWQKGPRAKLMLYPYYALLASTSAATMYMMGRMVLVRLHCFLGHPPVRHMSNTTHRATRLGSPATRRLPTVYYRNRAPLRQVQNTHTQSSFFPSISVSAFNYRLACHIISRARCCYLHVQIAPISMLLSVSSGPF